MKNIILIENDVEIQNKLKELFDDHGMHDFNILPLYPSDFKNTQKILESCFNQFSKIVVDNKNIDLVLVDINLKGSDSSDRSGVFVAEELKKNYKNIPFILMSSLINDVTMDEFFVFSLCINDGVINKNYIFKDFTSDKFENIIKQAQEKNMYFSVPEPSKEDTKKLTICILTATDIEREALKHHFKSFKPIPTERYKFSDDEIYHHLFYNKDIEIISNLSISKGLVHSATLSTKMNAHFKPDFIINIGICAGFKERSCTIGDIIIPSSIWDYSFGKIAKEKGDIIFKPYSEAIPLNNKLKIATEEFITNELLYDIRKENEHIFKSKNDITCHIKPFASGPAVVAVEEKAEEIKIQHGEIVGFEMEAYSIFHSTFKTNEQTKALVIKGVSDYADENKGTELKDIHQNYAVHNCILLFIKMLSTSFFHNFR